VPPCRRRSSRFVTNSRFFKRTSPPRLRLQRSDRFLWVLLSRWWPGWRRSLHIVAPIRLSLGTAEPSLGRRTLDVDLGIAVRGWDHFQLLKAALVEQAGFQPHVSMVQRITYPSKPAVVVDLIPFGGVETADRTIAWPPKEDIVMRVTGVRDGLESSVPVRLDQNLILYVVRFPVLLVLKLFAWKDRKHEMRDAPDIYTLLRQYGDAGNEDRLFGEDMNVLEAEGYDFELAGARLIGRDAARLASSDTQKRLREILESDALMEELTNQIIVSSLRNDPEHLGRCKMLIRDLREGFLPPA
jgi:predicted nucleotidyltransferase